MKIEQPNPTYVIELPNDRELWLSGITEEEAKTIEKALKEYARKVRGEVG